MNNIIQNIKSILLSHLPLVLILGPLIGLALFESSPVYNKTAATANRHDIIAPEQIREINRQPAMPMRMDAAK